VPRQPHELIQGADVAKDDPAVVRRAVPTCVGRFLVDEVAFDAA
jgi:hypothetical protein